MNNKIVRVPSIEKPIQPSPGFEKKLLSEYKLDLAALCGFGCRYCSSNAGNYLRIHRREFQELSLAQVGTDALPADDPSLMYVWDDVLDKLRAQFTSRRRPGFGRGQTLVFSMLTDGFSPWLVEQGVTRAALDLVLQHSEFRIRVLTKSAVVGDINWLQYFLEHPDRFVVGLSTGTLDDRWATQIELGTSVPSERLAALSALQRVGVPTYGMLCPVFPDVLQEDGLEELLDRVDPSSCEHVWAEPYNDRDNWEIVRSGYARGSAGYEFLSRVYGDRDTAEWSRYATELYLRLREHAERNGWLGKLRYLLYEGLISEADAAKLGDLQGILLQSQPADDGLSQNPHIRRLQVALEAVRA